MLLMCCKMSMSGCRWAGKASSHLHTLLNSRKGTSHILGQRQKVPIKSALELSAVQLSNWPPGSNMYVACGLLLLHLRFNLTRDYMRFLLLYQSSALQQAGSMQERS